MAYSRFAEPAQRLALPEGMRDEARATACAIGERLLQEMERADAVDPNGERFANRSLNGPPGFALAFLALAGATHDPRFEAAMHAQLRRAAASGDALEPGLLNGISSLRAVADLATELEPRYGRLAEQCDAFVETRLPDEAPARAAYGEYDLAFGWAGMRLARCVNGSREPDRLVDLLGWVIADDARWCSTHPLRPDEPAENNLGMAHGIPGALAALVLTLSDCTPEMREGIARCARGLAARARSRDGANVWPRAAQDPASEACRSVWCFGTPGVAIALLQVAQFLGDRELEAFAVDALARIAGRPRDAWLMTQSGICHGTIGTALVFAVAAERTDAVAFASVSAGLVRTTIDELAASGGRTITPGFDGVEYDAIGELNGVAGIATALLTLSGDFSPAWLRLHGMQP
jgi:hypothetical protein